MPYGGPTGSIFVSYSPYGSFALDPFSYSPYISYENYTDLAPRDGSAPWQAPLTGSIDSWGVSANLQIELSDHLTLTSITGYREFDGNYSSGDGSPFSNTLQANRVFNRQFSQELRLTGEIAEHRQLHPRRLLFRQAQPQRVADHPADAAVHRGECHPVGNDRGFANVDVAVTDRLNLIVGLRYTDQEKELPLRAVRRAGVGDAAEQPRPPSPASTAWSARSRAIASITAPSSSIAGTSS